MRKASIRSILCAQIFLIDINSALASNEIVHETGPIHLAGCMPPLSDWISTTLGVNAQTSEVYQARVAPASLSGSLIKQHADTEKRWDAGALLDQRTEARRIFISDETGVLMPFEWSWLSNAQHAMLDLSPSTSVSDGLGERRLRYLLGERSDEQGQVTGGIFPRRDSLLGGIVHSVPVRVGVPSGRWQSPAYLAFQQKHRDRRAVVYVGAADGMLHAFDDQSGKEVFAYILHVLTEKLPLLTAGPRFGVLPLDGGMATADVLVRSQWRTVLAVNLGRASQGVIALDVSDPDNFGSSENVLWTFTDRDDPDVGDLVGSPVIVKLRTGVSNGIAQYGSFMMVTSGVNNDRHDGSGRYSTSGTNALFLLSLDKPANQAWKHDVNYFKFSTAAIDQRYPNGMIELVTVEGTDGAVERAYAGDLQGNLWRFDFSTDLPLGNAKGTAAELLFTAKDGAANRQAITHKPAVVFAPGGGYIVLFGTGRYLSRSDLDRAYFSTQSFYAVLDRSNAKNIERSDLVPRSLIIKDAGGSFEIAGDAFIYGASGAGRKGWFFDFTDSASSGERIVSPLSIVGSHLVFSSLLPLAKSCEVPTGRIYMLNTLSGLATNVGFQNAHLSSGVPGSFAIYVSQLRDDKSGEPVIKRQTNRAVDIVQAGSPAIQIDLPASTSSKAGRLSWRELVNWIELRR